MASPPPPPSGPQFTAPPPYGGFPASGPPRPGPWLPQGPPSGVTWPPQNLPYPDPPGDPVAPGPVPQRPASIGIAATLSVTASLQWVCGLSFAWLVATAGAAELASTGSSGSFFHILNRFHYRMLEGMAWPLYLVPAASCVLGFWILSRKPWTRIAYSAMGALALAWSAWLLRDHLLWWIVPAGYIALATAIVWTSSANAWYGWGRRPRRLRDSSPAA